MYMCVRYIPAYFASFYHVQLFSSVEASGFIHDDHEDLINKHVMMIRVTDNI
jgi:hypothetical protein